MNILFHYHIIKVASAAPGTKFCEKLSNEDVTTCAWLDFMLRIHCFLEMSKFDLADCHWCIMVSLRCIKYLIQQFRLIASDTFSHTLTHPDWTVKLTFLFNLFVLHYKIFHKTVEGPGTGLNVRLFDFYQVGGPHARLGSVCEQWVTTVMLFFQQ